MEYKRDFLRCTWGVVNSKAHSDYIISVAVSNGIKVNKTSYKCNFFTFVEHFGVLSLWIYSREASIDKGKCNMVEIKELNAHKHEVGL